MTRERSLARWCSLSLFAVRDMYCIVKSLLRKTHDHFPKKVLPRREVDVVPEPDAAVPVHV
jgi:hypothetical protein